MRSNLARASFTAKAVVPEGARWSGSFLSSLQRRMVTERGRRHAAPDRLLLEPGRREGGSGGQGDGPAQEGQRLHVGAHEVAGAARVPGKARALGPRPRQAAVGPQAQAAGQGGRCRACILDENEMSRSRSELTKASRAWRLAEANKSRISQARLRGVRKRWPLSQRPAAAPCADRAAHKKEPRTWSSRCALWVLREYMRSTYYLPRPMALYSPSRVLSRGYRT